MKKGNKNKFFRNYDKQNYKQTNQQREWPGGKKGNRMSTDKSQVSPLPEMVDYQVTKYHGILYMLVASIVFSALWALLRWAWIELDLFPNAKGYVTDIVVPGILSGIYLLVCYHFIKSIKDKIEDKVWFGAFAFSFLLLWSTGSCVESMLTQIVELPRITAEQKQTLAEADYIHVTNLSQTDLDLDSHGWYLDYSMRSRRHGEDIVFHFYEVYALRSIPNVFIGHEKEQTHDYTYANLDKLNKQSKLFGEAQQGHLSHLEMNNCYLKRLLPKDNIEGYRHAVETVPDGVWKSDQRDEPLILEIVDEPKDISFYGSIWMVALLVGALLLTIIFTCFFVKAEYVEAANDTRKFKLDRLWQYPDYILLFSLPVFMVLVLLMMYLNGFSADSDSSNLEMLIRWGALNHDLVTDGGEWWRLLTFGFLHGGFMHLIYNVFSYVIMVFLLIRYDGYRITAVFLVSSVVSGFFFLLFSSGTVVGASGGVFGLMTFWFVDLLYAKLIKKLPFINLKMLLFATLMIVWNLIMCFGNGVSMSGHLGGLVAGCVLGILFIFTKKDSKAEKAKPKKGRRQR